MELTALSLTQVLTVLGAFGAGVVVFYLLKLRRRQVPVPFVRLWEQILAEKQTTRLFSQLKRLLSLLLALLFVALLAFAMGDPRIKGASDSGRSLVVLIDASTSMQATDNRPSRLDQAREEARRIIDGLGPADRMLIAQMDATTTPVSPMTDDTRVLRESVTRVVPTDLAGNFARGLRFALDVLHGKERGEIVVISDGHLAEARDEEGLVRAEGAKLSFVPIGRHRRNISISAFSVRRYPLDKSRSEVLVELLNSADTPEAVELTLLGDGQPIDVQRLELRPGERISRFFENISGADRTLEAKITLADGQADDLPADNHAYARLPERRRARVLSVSPGNRYIEAALLLDEYLDVTEISPSQYPVEGHFDVVLFDGFVPPSPPDTNAVYLNPLPAAGVAGPVEVRGTIDRPFFDQIDRRHPLVRWTALHDVNVAAALQVRAQPGDRVVASDSRGPLLVAGNRNGKKFVALTFDIRQSDLPLRVAWPLLLLNSIDWFISDDAAYLSSYTVGESWHVGVAPGSTTATLVSPDGATREVPVVDGRAVCTGTRAGFYHVRTAQDDVLIAANLDANAESDIAPVARLDVQGQVASRFVPGNIGVRREIWIYLVLAALMLIAFEWHSYHRRWTV